jgi:lactoylglutathione lyase
MKIFALSLLTLVLLCPVKKTMAQSQPQPVAVVNHIAIYVADLKQATDFYKTLFNLEIIPEPFHDGKHTWFALGGTTARLHIIQGATSKGTYNINEHMCFSVPSVDGFIKILQARNIRFGNFAGVAGEVTHRPDGVNQIYFQDPDGHWLEVNDAKS